MCIRLRYRAEGHNRLNPEHPCMYHVYEYEATKTCPECSDEETVPVTTYIDEGNRAPDGDGEKASGASGTW